MIRTHTAIMALSFAIPATAWAEVPNVVTDFPPVYSLTAQVMEGVGTPTSLLKPGDEPHHYDMTPADAAALSGADLVIWVGEGMTPWLTDPIAALAPSAAQLTLLETDGWTQLEPRSKAVHADEHDDDHAHEEEHADGDHGHDEGHSDDHGHDDGHDDDHTHAAEHSDEHGHDDHADHDDHDAHAGHGHDHGDVDPHAWTDPDIAAVWIGHIAQALSEADPDNADAYARNAAAAQEDMAALAAEMTTILQDATGGYILPHDGYQYFETRFDLPSAGTIAASDASAPGPARIAALRDMMADRNVTCVLTDRETDPAWAALIKEGTDTNTAVIDATATLYPLGPDAYTQMMRTVARTVADCLDGK